MANATTFAEKYIYGFGDCFIINSFKEIEGIPVRYYGISDNNKYAIYGTTVYGYNIKLENALNVEFYAINLTQ